MAKEEQEKAKANRESAKAKQDEAAASKRVSDETKKTKDTPNAKSPGTAIFLIMFCKFVTVKKYSLVNVPIRQIIKNTKSKK